MGRKVRATLTRTALHQQYFMPRQIKSVKMPTELANNALVRRLKSLGVQDLDFVWNKNGKTWSVELSPYVVVPLIGRDNVVRQISARRYQICNAKLIYTGTTSMLLKLEFDVITSMNDRNGTGRNYVRG